MEDFLLKFAANFGFFGLVIAVFTILEIKKNTISNLFGKKEFIDSIKIITVEFLNLKKEILDIKDYFKQDILAQNEFLKGMMSLLTDHLKIVDNKLEDIDLLSQQTKIILNDQVNLVTKMITNINEKIKKTTLENQRLKQQITKKIIIYVGYKIKSYCIEQNERINKELFSDLKKDTLEILIKNDISKNIKDKIEFLINWQEKLNDEERCLSKEQCLRIKSLALEPTFLNYHFNRLIDNFYVKTNGDDLQLQRKKEGFKNIIKIYIEALLDIIEKTNLFKCEE